MTEHDGFESLLTATIPNLRRYARSLVRDADRAEDLVQETLLRAIRKQHLWEPGTNLRAWLFTLMHHQHVNDVRRRVRDAASVTVAGDEAFNAIPDYRGDPLPAIELKQLAQLIRRLPRQQQRVILLAALMGDNYERMADYEMIPVGTVRSRLSRGRAMLRLLAGGTELSAEERERLGAELVA